MNVGDRVVQKAAPGGVRGTVLELKTQRGELLASVDWDTGKLKSVSPRKAGQRVRYTHRAELLEVVR